MLSAQAPHVEMVLEQWVWKWVECNASIKQLGQLGLGCIPCAETKMRKPLHEHGLNILECIKNNECMHVLAVVFMYV